MIDAGVRSSLGAAILVVALFLLVSGPRPAARQPQTHAFDLLTAEVEDIQAAVAAGALTYERLVQLYLDRIAAYDKAGPRLNAVIHVNPHALTLARELDRERRTSGPRGPLHGIPLAVKDNVDTAGLPTTGGSLVFAGNAPPRDATIVERLRAAGAIVLVKTNLDEFALSSQGLSSHGGQTLNAYDPSRSPGGSSGGTAVAVAAGFAAIGIATETGQSIRSPAANTAVVGVAPSRGLISRAGVIPISFSQDRVGVHARTVRDAAHLLHALRGFDADDLSTAAAFGQGDASPYVETLNIPVDGIRLGVLRDLTREGEMFAPGNRLVRTAAERLRERVTVVDSLTTGIDLITRMPTLRANNYEVRFAFDAYLQRRGATSPVRSLAEMMKTGKYLPSLESRYAQALKVAALDRNQAYLDTLARQKEVRDALLALMDRERLDALLYPTKSLTAPPIGVAESDGGTRDNPISSTTGLPAVVVPVGLHPDGLPIGMELLGRPFSEPILLRIAATYETLRGPRPLPPTTPPLPRDRFRY